MFHLAKKTFTTVSGYRLNKDRLNRGEVAKIKLANELDRYLKKLIGPTQRKLKESFEHAKNLSLRRYIKLVPGTF